MEYSKIEKRFGDWGFWFKEFIESEKFDSIFKFLKGETAKKKEIFPVSADLFRSFEVCPHDNVKCLVIMMDPYPTKTKDGTVIADGIPMSCQRTGKLQPSLDFWYHRIETDYMGFDPDMDLRADCSYLLKEEGVMLINSSLTVEMSKPGSHQATWEPFMQFFIESIINVYYRGLPIILCGQSAQKLEKYINPLIHHIHKTTHPASVAHSGGTEWCTDMFRFIDRIIEANNGPSARIRWWRKKNETPYPKEMDIDTTKYKHKETKSAKELNLPWSD